MPSSDYSGDEQDATLSDSDFLFEWSDGIEHQHTPFPDTARCSATGAHSLLRDPNHIRVLELNDGRDDEPIRCFVKTISLDDPPIYMTLSYACGPTHADGSHLTDVVVCNNCDLAITANLYGALKQIRSLLRNDRFAKLASKPFLWVDAICINQHDVKERSKQVSLMAQIYSRSSQLLIWLGELPEFRRTVSFLEQRAPEQRTSALPQIVRAQCASLFTDATQKEWFRRRWIIQEYLLSQTVVFLMGNYLVQECMFKEYAALALQLPPVLVQDGSPGKRLSLMRNLDLYSQAKCSDPKDIIYSLLSISRDGNEFEVDYSQDMLSICLRVTRTYIDRGMLMSVLARAMHNPMPVSGRMDWPSWLPDWRAPPQVISSALDWRSTSAIGTYAKPVDRRNHQIRYLEFHPQLSSSRFVQLQRPGAKDVELFGWILTGKSDYWEELKHMFKTRDNDIDELFVFICPPEQPSLGRLALVIENSRHAKHPHFNQFIDLVPWRETREFPGATIPNRFSSMAIIDVPCPGALGGNQRDCKCSPQAQRSCKYNTGWSECWIIIQ